jgi:hypothetical protein
MWVSPFLEYHKERRIMPRNYSRTQKLTPWYHQPMERCVTITLAKEQCTYSASYVDETGRIKLCKTHRDMMPDVFFKKITPKTIDIRDERANVTRIRRAK